MHDFQQYDTIRSFGDSMYNCKLNIIEAEEDQNNLLNNIVEFDNKSRPRSKEGKDKKEIVMKVQMFFNTVEN